MKYILLVALFTFSAYAKNHPYNQEFSLKVKELFWEDNALSPSKVNAYINRLEQKKAELSHILGNQLILQGEDDQEEIFKEVSKHKFIIALDLATEKLKNLDQENFWSHTYEALDLEAAIRIEGQGPPLEVIMNQIRNFFQEWIVKKNTLSTEESSNLFDPESGSFLGPEDIDLLRSQNKDLSLYQPDPSSTFWEKPKNISQTSLKEASLGRTLKVYKDLKIEFPSDNVFFFDEVKHSDTKPKVDVFFKNAEGKKVKFKLKFGAEIHADPTLAAIMMTLGFPADITKYEKQVKVIFLKGQTLSDLKRDWEVFYKREGTYKIEKYIQETGTDEKGREFVIFKEGLLEAKPNKITRLGGWSFGDFGHTSAREVRGLTLIQMWLDNSDIKEFDNNRLLMKKTDSGYERYHIISDLGHSLGYIFNEIPELYSTKMISGQSSDAVIFKYRAFQPTKVKNTLTYDDARWATRLIAALSRTQIQEAIQIGSWPKCVGEIYVEKMLSRRNDLVQNFGLENEFPLIPTSDDTNFETKCDLNELRQNYTSNFDFDMGFLLKPAVQTVLRGILDLARGGIGGVNRITLTDVELELDTSFLSQIIINVKRDIEKNNHPTSEKDLYLVRDHFEAGMRLGPAYGAFVDFVYTRSFSLSYPVRSMDEARMHNGFIVNVLLPLDMRRGKLPEKYVLRTEHFMEVGTGVEADVRESPVGISVRAKASRINLMRSYVDHKDPKRIVLYREQAKAWQQSLKVFARLMILKIPVLNTLNNWGKSYGVGSIVEQSYEDEIADAAIEGDFSGLRKKEEEFRLENAYKEKRFGWKFFFWRGNKDERLDRVSLYRGDTKTEKLQFKTSADSKWSFFGKSESNEVSVEVFNDLSQAENYQLRLNVANFDSNTRDKEMGQNYLYFINGLAPDGRPLIPLSVSLGYTTNGKWGKTVTQSTNTYYPEAMKKILNLNEEDYWEALAGVMKKTNMEFFGLRNNYMIERNNQKAIEANPNHAIIDKSQDFLKRLRKLKTIVGAENRIREIGHIFKKIPFKKGGFYEGKILGALNRLVKTENFYSHNVISAPLFEEINLIDEAPLFGFAGKDRKLEFEFLTYNPTTPGELYYMFDQWF